MLRVFVHACAAPASRKHTMLRSQLLRRLFLSPCCMRTLAPAFDFFLPSLQLGDGRALGDGGFVDESSLDALALLILLAPSLGG